MPARCELEVNRIEAEMYKRYVDDIINVVVKILMAGLMFMEDGVV